MSGLYLQPAGFIYGEAAQTLLSQGLAGRLAHGTTAFTSIAMIKRDGGTRVTSWHSYSDISASSESAIQRLLHRLAEPRCLDGRPWTAHPLIMGIVNVTPDSFSDGGDHFQSDAAIAHAEMLVEAGADILDVGGESTRPGAEPVEAGQERTRILPVIRELAAKGHRVSVDTRKAFVMREAVAAGAMMINDVSALSYDHASLEVAAAGDCPVVLMHAQGDPRTMQDDPRYDDVVLDIYDYLEGRIADCQAHGIDRARLIIDPGLGFGKTFDHNLSLIREMAIFHGLGLPMMIGASRKGFIGKMTGEIEASQRLAGSLAVNFLAALSMAQILRVHDVRETRQMRDVISQTLHRPIERR